MHNKRFENFLCTFNQNYSKIEMNENEYMNVLARFLEFGCYLFVRKQYNSAKFSEILGRHNFHRLQYMENIIAADLFPVLLLRRAGKG